MASVPHCLRVNKQICCDCSTEPAALSAIHTCIHPAAHSTQKEAEERAARLPGIFEPEKDVYIIYRPAAHATSQPQTYSRVTGDVTMQRL